jgi:adenylate cyclase
VRKPTRNRRLVALLAEFHECSALFDVGNGSHLWSHRFDRRLEDVFAIQDEIAPAIVDQLKVSLLAEEKVSLVRRHTDNLEAHNACLIGLFEWHKMIPEGFVRCQQLLREAIDHDPNFAPAYAQLADHLPPRLSGLPAR